MQRRLFGRSRFMKLIDITDMSLLRGDAMVSGADTDTFDCLHPCLPGLPDSWVDVFYMNWLKDPRFR